MHIIELRKLAAQVKKLNLAQDGVARWGRFMLDPTPATLAELRVYSPVFEEVKMVMAEISASERARLLADSRQKGRLDQLQRELDAERRGKTEGWAEGRAEGEARGLRTAALGMLKKGVTVGGCGRDSSDVGSGTYSLAGLRSCQRTS